MGMFGIMGNSDVIGMSGMGMSDVTRRSDFMGMSDVMGIDKFQLFIKCTIGSNNMNWL